VRQWLNGIDLPLARRRIRFVASAEARPLLLKGLMEPASG